ncbi:equilibrative nucleoside transporter 4 isoform X2 [Erinaceus europaeus]|uniref:Equilibrative nucleoside transporter 4 isoform X2 n=1 Tax=Erinaceus europaeus TaxID=9365 RepID=A0ABM3VY17_ERIEU|nr:equilibrative nucleoside transporter 4 isoform X2 [Erinaceus europaeus]
MGSAGSRRLREPSTLGTPEGGVLTSFSFEENPGGSSGGAPSHTDAAEQAPEDRYHGIYFAMLLAGVGFLLPYNSFITDVDYLHHKYPGTPIVFDLSLTYILVALGAVLLNNVLVERLSLHTRITAGYLLALGPLLFISVCDVWLQLLSRDQAYAVNLAAAGIVALGCTVQQSSFYGYTGMLPQRYTQGVMTGESTAGVVVSLSRILTKLLLPERAGTLLFFLLAAALELLCLLLHLLLRRSRFVRFHTARAPARHPELADPGGSPRDSPAHEVACGPTYTRFDLPGTGLRRSWPTLRALLLHRYAVARVIWAYMLSMAVTYFITLCLFPGLESQIRHCALGDWLPILVMAVFNLSDFVGKILAALPLAWRGPQLLACSCLRAVFIPLFILCVYPGRAPALRHPAWPCVFSLLMGISNGYFGSVPMILAAGKVGPRLRELAGEPAGSVSPRPQGPVGSRAQQSILGPASWMGEDFREGAAPGSSPRTPDSTLGPPEKMGLPGMV